MIFLLANWQRFAVYAVVALSVGFAIWMHGYTRGELKLYDYQAKQAAAAVPVIVRQGAVTERVVTRYRDRIVKVKGDTEVITKEIVRYVPPAADVVLPTGWVRLHDAAATRTVPAPPAGTDVAAPAIAASEALRGVIGNYDTCYAQAAQLLALQDWVRFQYQAMNQEALGY